MLPTFALARPTTVDDAIGLLCDEQVPYCGGTELLLAMRVGLLRPAGLVDLKCIDDLVGVTGDDGVVTIRAATTHASVAVDARVRAAVPLLAKVARGVGNARVRAQGSIGGNLCFAEPKSDITTVLAALGASVGLRASTGDREVIVEDFLVGAYTTCREPDELLVDVRIPVPRGPGVYLKYQTMERPTTGVALVPGPAGDQVRVAVGAVGEIPVVASYERLDEVDANEIAAAVDPIPDLGGSVEYKRHVTAVYVRKAVAAFDEEVSS